MMVGHQNLKKSLIHGPAIEGGVHGKKMFVIAMFLVLLPVVGVAQAKIACDRGCLEGYVDKYMDAMLSHQPSASLFSKDCKFTENGVRLPLGGEGLWYSMSGKGTYKFYVPDIEAQQVAFLGTAREGAEGKEGAKGTPSPLRFG
jgi:hypothetical protein